MNSPKIALALTLALAAFTAPAVARQDANPPEPARDVLEEVSGIHDALVRMVEVLEALREHQNVDLLLKRIERQERRLAPLERRLGQAQSSLSGVESEIGRLAARRQQIEEQLGPDLDRMGDESEGAQADRETLVHIERELELQQVDLEARSEQVRRLEDELAEQREEIEDLDEMLLEMLD